MGPLGYVEGYCLPSLLATARGQNTYKTQARAHRMPPCFSLDSKAHLCKGSRPTWLLWNDLDNGLWTLGE